MLIKKGISTNEIVTLKLVTSEELVGKLKEETDTHYIIEHPLTLVMSQKGLGLQPWLFTVDTEKDFSFPKEKVMIIMPTMKEMAVNYLQGTSGIVLA
jgi:hypothetical protein